MAIFYDEYLNENGGAHRKAFDLSAKHFDKFTKFADIAEDDNNDSTTRKAARKLSAKHYNASKSIDDKLMSKTGDSLTDIDSRLDNVRSRSELNKIIKDNIGAGKNNMPKNRESGTYLKMQSKIKGMKEACEYILNMIDEEE